MMITRVPVVSPEGIPLMPTIPARARKWIESGKAVKRWAKTGQFYVQLVQEPSGYETQEIVIGVDPGKLYSGIGVQSAKASLFMAHLVLPFLTIRRRMEQRATVRRTRRGRRVKRFSSGKIRIKFKDRNHRQVRYSNRRKSKLPPSIKANRELELRVIRELHKIYPISKIVYEVVKARGSSGFSPVMVGQNWMLSELEKLNSVSTIRGYNTFNIRNKLSLKKTSEKSQQTPESHAVDGIAISCSEFIKYTQYHRDTVDGGDWFGDVEVTPCHFSILQRPKYSRRQLHQFTILKGGGRKRYGGSVLSNELRKGDLVKGVKAGVEYYGYVSGESGNSISISDGNWKRISYFTKSKVKLIKRSTGLCLA